MKKEEFLELLKNVTIDKEDDKGGSGGLITLMPTANNTHLGGFMKKVFCMISCSLVMLSSLGCFTPHCDTEININNQSSYDLRLDFKHSFDKWVWYPELKEYGFPDNIDVAKNSTRSIRIAESYFLTTTDPNKYIQKITFLNLSDSTILKEVENNNLFILTKTEKILLGDGIMEASFLLNITDELLEE